MTYTATYTQIPKTTYTIIFKDWDGTVLSKKSYNSGATVQKPANPTRPDDATYYYTFAGWSPAVSTTATASVTYTATYTATKLPYTVTFQDWDGTVLSQRGYRKNATVELPANPTRAADTNFTYQFDRWDPTVTNVTANATYTAVYTKTLKDQTATWVKDNGKWYYYEKGVMVTNAWRQDTTGWCYLGSDGAMVTGAWLEIGEDTYYVNDSGYRVSGTVTIDGQEYIFDDAGKLLGIAGVWKQENSKWYYYESGVMIKNAWRADNTGWCYLGSDGAMVTGIWIRSNGNYYYVNNSGYRLSGTHTIDGMSYQFDSDGTLLTDAPAIMTSPNAITVNSGSTVKFAVSVEGEIASYCWQYRKVYKWFDTSLTGYNTAALSVPATGARNDYDYRCVITFADGTVLNSEPANLTVNTTLSVTGNPVDQTMVLGYKGQFTAAAEGEGIKYQWQYKRPDGDRWIDTAMEGANKPTVMIETTVARNGYQYRCRITDVTGKEAYSAAATLRVLSIKEHPQDALTTPNATVTFTIKTNLADGFAYQWQYTSNGTSWSNTTMTGYNTATLSVKATAARDGYQYRCVLTGAKNSKLISNPATLHVVPPVSIAAQPVDVMGIVGDTVKFTVAANYAYGYQWQYCTKSSTTWRNTSLPGYNTDTLSVEVTANRDGYRYRCVVSGANGTTATSASATLTTAKAASVTTQPADKTAAVGTTVQFKVSATHTVGYQWQYCTASGTTWRNTSFTGCNTDTLSVPVLASRNGYRYRCVLTGENGSQTVTNEATLTVK